MTSKTPQELFETAVRGLAAQGFRRSMQPNEATCAFRGQDGCKCAVGQLIPDSAGPIPEVAWYALPRRILEAVGLNLRPVQHVGTAGFSFPKEKAVGDMLTGLTFAHDNGVTPNIMRISLRLLAEKMEVTVPADVSLDTVPEKEAPVADEPVPF